MSVGSCAFEARIESTCWRTLSTASASKRGLINAVFKSAKASARFSDKMRTEIDSVSSLTSKLKEAESASLADAKACESKSPAPSSNSPVIIYAAPRLSGGSRAAPPENIMFKAVKGIAGSSKTQAERPPGLVTVLTETSACTAPAQSRAPRMKMRIILFPPLVPSSIRSQRLFHQTAALQSP